MGIMVSVLNFKKNSFENFFVPRLRKLKVMAVCISKEQEIKFTGGAIKMAKNSIIFLFAKRIFCYLMFTGADKRKNMHSKMFLFAILELSLNHFNCTPRELNFLFFRFAYCNNLQFP